MCRLRAGEFLLQAVSDGLGLGILKCSRAETDHLAGAFAAAQASLEGAQSLAAEVGAGPKSELGLAISRVLHLRDQIPSPNSDASEKPFGFA